MPASGGLRVPAARASGLTFVGRQDGAPIGFTGSWETRRGPEGPVETCTIATTGPDAVTARSTPEPVILAPPGCGRRHGPSRGRRRSSSATGCSMARSSTRWREPRSWSKAGGAPTTPAARTRPWAASRSRHGLLYRRLGRPPGPRHRSRSCARCRAGPPRGGRPRRGDHVRPAPAPLGHRRGSRWGSPGRPRRRSPKSNSV